jgi:hypothetical protein
MNLYDKAQQDAEEYKRQQVQSYFRRWTEALSYLRTLKGDRLTIEEITTVSRAINEEAFPSFYLLEDVESIMNRVKDE